MKISRISAGIGLRNETGLTKVYLVYGRTHDKNDNEACDVDHQVFSTRELAERFVKDFAAGNSSYEIEELEVDKQV